MQTLGTVSVLGGDKRYIYLTSYLAEMGYRVNLIASAENIELADGVVQSSLIEALPFSDMIIFPIPISRDDEHLFAPLHSEKIPLTRCFSYIEPDSLVIGGVINNTVAKLAALHELMLYDILDTEELSIKNAIPTAEGALELAIASTEKTIFGSKCLIIGYGRISKILGRMLQGLGAKVTITSRRSDHRAWIEAEGYSYCYTHQLRSYPHQPDIIFNTVPDAVLTHSILEKFSPDTLIIDLAASTGGTDFDAADKLGIKAIHALSLPGKTAPRSAAKYIAEVADEYYQYKKGGL